MFSLDIATSPSGRRIEAWVVGLLLLACFVLPRVAHLGPVIDRPHAWVQVDREFTVWAYYRYGLSLVDMHVCYFGGHRTNLLEFPLPDLVPAILYRLFGPHVLLARLSTLLFFAGAALFLYLFLKRLFDRRFATLGLAVYLVLPLGIYYSRAVLMHDFFAIFMAHAMVYFYLRGIDEERGRLLAIGSLCATLGLLVKAPYVFYFFLPLGAYALRRWRGKRLLALLACFALPVVPFLAWRAYVTSVNGAQPEWYFLPGYIKFVDMGHWYYGPLELRFDPENWAIIWDRFASDVVTLPGIVLFVLGLWWLRRERNAGFVYLWALGTVVAIAIFFRLNTEHSYYQNPLIAIGAVGIAACFWRAIPTGSPVTRRALAVAAVGLLAFAAVCVAVVESSDYGIDWTQVYAARAIEEVTAEDALVVTASPTIVGAQDPTLLGPAHRYGWAVESRQVTPELLERLRGEGATVLAWLAPGDAPPSPELLDYLAGAPVDVRDLPGGPAKLYVFQLAKAGHG